MKCYGALTLALAALTLASPRPAAKGSPQDVSAAIDKWLQDIKAVNKFVDTAGGLKSDADITNAAKTALKAAMDEGTQNDALASLTTLDSAGAAANKDLAGQFNIIGPAIKDTTTNPQNLQKNLNAINGARCPPPNGKGAIAQEGAVQQSAAKAAGVNAAQPEIPAACQKAAKNKISG